jgi:hypothetical protein
MICVLHGAEGSKIICVSFALTLLSCRHGDQHSSPVQGGTVKLPKAPQRYRSFLLRAWLQTDAEGWRFVVENPQNGQKQGFSSYQALISYIELELAKARQEEER